MEVDCLHRMLMNGMEPSTTYIIIFILQMIMLELAAFIATSTNASPSFVIMFSSGYLRVLQNRLSRMQKSEESDDEIYKTVVEHSKFHQKILK